MSEIQMENEIDATQKTKKEEKKNRRRNTNKSPTHIGWGCCKPNLCSTLERTAQALNWLLLFRFEKRIVCFHSYSFSD